VGLLVPVEAVFTSVQYGFQLCSSAIPLGLVAPVHSRQGCWQLSGAVGCSIFHVACEFCSMAAGKKGRKEKLPVLLEFIPVVFPYTMFQIFSLWPCTSLGKLPFTPDITLLCDPENSSIFHNDNSLCGLLTLHLSHWFQVFEHLLGTF
jgi:hypothetical protein